MAAGALGRRAAPAGRSRRRRRRLRGGVRRGRQQGHENCPEQSHRSRGKPAARHGQDVRCRDQAMSLLDFRRAGSHPVAVPPAERGAERSVQSASRPCHASRRPASALTDRAVREAPGVEVDLDVAALEVAADQLLRERILDVALDRAAERPGAVRAVLAGLLDDPVDDVAAPARAGSCGPPGCRSAASPAAA